MDQAQFNIVATTFGTLTEHLRLYVALHMNRVHGDNWQPTISKTRKPTPVNLPTDCAECDIHTLLTIMWDNWNNVFRHNLGLFERSLVAELRAFCNRWARQRRFGFDDTYRLLDSTQRLLSQTSPQATTEISSLKLKLLREEFDEAIQLELIGASNRVHRGAVAVGTLCCGAICVWLIPQMFANGGGAAYLLAATTATAVIYLTFKQYRDQPIPVGPRECRRCRRIVYGIRCPYCVGNSRTNDSGDLTSAQLIEGTSWSEGNSKDAVAPTLHGRN